MKAYRSKRRFFLSASLHSFLLLLLCFFKGWTLPENSGNTVGGYNNSYGNLLWKEGVITSDSEKTSYTTGGFQKLSSPPLSFARCGIHETTGTTLLYRGSYADYWSRSTLNASYSRYLYFTSGSIPPQYDETKAYGFSLRCVAW